MDWKEQREAYIRESVPAIRHPFVTSYGHKQASPRFLYIFRHIPLLIGVIVVKLQEGSNGQKLVTIPRELCKAMGWEKGDELNFSVKDKNVLQLKK